MVRPPSRQKPAPIGLDCEEKPQVLFNESDGEDEEFGNIDAVTPNKQKIIDFDDVEPSFGAGKPSLNFMNKRESTKRPLKPSSFM